MISISEVLQNVFTKNRTEELGYDVWKNFVVPHFYDRLDLYGARKSRVIVGGRGCGKTMLLRYLAHQSAFSPDRPTIPAAALAHIGLYWRADTQFAKLMTGRNIEDDVWASAFNHLLALVVAVQILQSLHSIAISKSDALQEHEIRTLRFERLSSFDPSLNQTFEGLLKALDTRLCEFEVWVANARKLPQPTFLPVPSFLLALINTVKEQLPKLKESTYFVYLDEYENLHEYQQQIVNTYLKHSEMPLIFNIAMKRHGFMTTKTVGDESIIDIADYRKHDLEQYILEGDFPLFAAEVLFLNLAIANEDVPIDPRVLRDVSALATRREPAYRNIVLQKVGEVFPGMSQETLAQSVFEDMALQRKLKERIRLALRARNSTLEVDRFYRPHLAQASITASALLHRSKPDAEEVAHDLDRLERGEDNRFTGKTNWIHNNFIGCLLSLYESHSRACPFYSGFQAFCLMSRGNLRHFLELCHKSIDQFVRVDGGPILRVSPKDQSLAARQASAAFLGEIRSFGRLGNQLHTFTLRLGSLFALAHRSLTQSEPERCHFVIGKGKTLTDDDHTFLRQAVKWSVMFEEEETKVKEPAIQQANFEYVLNPIYAPYFCITYRKKRKLELPYDEFVVLKDGSYDEVRTLLKRYAREWSVELTATDPTLFSHLLDENDK